MGVENKINVIEIKNGNCNLEVGGRIIINHTEEDQRQFINTAFPTIKILTKLKDKELVFIGWYELMDEENPSVPIEPEKHFGILHSNFTQKLGYEDLKQQFSEW